MNHPNLKAFQSETKKNKVLGESSNNIFPRWFIFIFVLFSIYMVLPLFDFPLLGLSLSAPLFFVLAIHTILKPFKPWFKKYEKWWFLAASIWLGIFTSFIANELIGRSLNFNSSGARTVIRYLYWLIEFVVVVYILAYQKMMRITIKYLGIGIIVVALLRWFEAIVFGRLGYWSGTEIFSQNSYGYLFSTFSPFAFAGILERGQKNKLIKILSLIIIWGAAAVNGSRGSWIAMGFGVLLLIFFLLISRPKKLAQTIIILLIIFGAFLTVFFNFPSIRQAIVERASSFYSLEEDKTYVIRQVLNKKSIIIFKESPVFGIGPSRYSSEFVEIEFPELFGAGSLDRFNRKSSHNSYLGFLAENGLVGALPLGILLIYLGIKGGTSVIINLKQNQYLSLYCFISFLQMSIHFWVLSGLQTTSTWFIYGLVGGVIMMSKDKS